jgi:hypothetical protein
MDIFSDALSDAQQQTSELPDQNGYRKTTFTKKITKETPAVEPTPPPPKPQEETPSLWSWLFGWIFAK